MNEWEWNLLEDKAPVEFLEIRGVEVHKGDRVRLHPRSGGDILDLALDGQIAVVESLEQDYEGKQHVSVVVESDPGREFGIMRQPGHRFFFSSDEVEPLPFEEQEPKPRAVPRILVAGIGNIFLGDDGFGVEVVRRLASLPLPAEVRVVDFGIRGLDLVYALEDEYETTILVDAFPHGKTPGTVSVVEPDKDAIQPSGENFVEPHSMHPMNVLRMAKSLHGSLVRVLLVGCEPASLGGDEGHMGLSEPVEAAVDEAVRAIEVLVRKLLAGESV
ncbi:MAG: hydrogenase maturation protease [Acidobacteriaceae bacterium]